MCSVALIRPGPGRCLLAMNRDELDGRPASLPPLRCDDRLLTVDGRAGGAWIGVNRHGLAAALLNRTVPGDRIPAAPATRGAIVPAALRHADADAAACALTAADLAALPPFTLVLADPQALRTLAWTGSALIAIPGDGPWTSSGLGDAAVAASRLAAWRRLGGDADAWLASRDGADGAAWVLMRRAGARTVARCRVEVGEAEVALSEVLLDPDGGEGRSVRLAAARR